MTITSQREHALAAIDDVIATVGILIGYLTNNDEEKSYEAISVMLLQVVTIYGKDSITMQQFFPVMDVIQRRINDSNLQGALTQAETFEMQLNEVRTMILQG